MACQGKGSLDASPARRLSAHDLAAGHRPDRAVRHRALSFDLAARSHGQFLAGFDLDPRIHRSCHHIAQPAPASRWPGDGGGNGVPTKTTPIASCVVDTVRRHPSLLAQSALTISHLSKGRFILGLGSGELENTVPFGFDFAKPVSRLEEAIKVIKLLWESDGPVDFAGHFYHLEHARMDTELYDGKAPPIWLGAAGPRMLKICGAYGDGWWPAGSFTPEDYAAKLKVILDAGDAARRDMSHFTPAITQICLIGDEGEVAEMLERRW